MKTNLISVVSPIFNEEEGIEEFLSETIKVLLTDKKYKFEIILVNDGSTDQTQSIVNHFVADNQDCGVNIHVLNFTRNFGHQAALLAGTEAAKGDAIITIDSDLQDPPNLIPNMIVEWEKGNHVVLMKRTSRGAEKRLKKYFSLAYYKILTKVSGFDSKPNVGDFRLISKDVKNNLIKFHPNNLYLRGAIEWMGFQTTIIEFDRHSRRNGETKYTFIKMFNLGITGIINSGQKLLRLPFLLSLIILISSILITFLMIYNKMFHPERTIPGFTSITLIIMWATTIIMFSIGVLGEYIYQTNLNSRGVPVFILNPETRNVKRKVRNN
jgi:glycosyltransferase involved in cell wall biosynthesis